MHLNGQPTSTDNGQTGTYVIITRESSYHVYDVITISTNRGSSRGNRARSRERNGRSSVENRQVENRQVENHQVFDTVDLPRKYREGEFEAHKSHKCTKHKLDTTTLDHEGFQQDAQGNVARERRTLP